LIDDLLDVTRISQGKLSLTFETVDAHELLHSALGICSNEISAKNLRIQVKLEAIGHRIRADAARLQQVFWNLIKNAVKFTPPNGQLQLRSSNPQSSWFRLEVVDSGIGIALDVLPRIFDPFEQGSTGSGGLGLGLTISKAIVELHEGRIFASSAGANRGATFVIELPNVVPSSADSSSSKIETQPSAVDATQDVATHRRILLVEDHVDSAGPMQSFLQSSGYHVTTAENVEAALQAAAQEEFDLLVSDIGLPDGTGEDLIRQLREKGHNLPAIALSGYGMQQDIERSRAAGFQVHLIKPVSPQQLQTTIDQLINKQRREADRNSEKS
jgi:two-component system CheB/CheR fusion protein